MDPLTHVPMPPDWTIPASRTASAADVIGALALVELADLEPWRAALAATGAELAAAAGCAWHWTGSDDPIVLVRALAALARRAPLAAGPLAGELTAALDELSSRGSP